MRTLRTTAVACVAVIALAGVAAAADPLALDDTFSADGWTTFDLGDPTGTAPGTWRPWAPGSSWSVRTRHPMPPCSR